MGGGVFLGWCGFGVFGYVLGVGGIVVLVGLGVGWLIGGVDLRVGWLGCYEFGWCCGVGVGVVGLS